MPISVHPYDWDTHACIPDDSAYDMVFYPGNLHDRYANYLFFTDDGKGGDITNGGKPLKSFDEWMEH
jgi:hypothetical protein